MAFIRIIQSECFLYDKYAKDLDGNVKPIKRYRHEIFCSLYARDLL